MASRHPPADSLDATTLQPGSGNVSLDELTAPALTILYHTDTSRIGERSLLNDPGGEGSMRLSRSHPLFAALGSSQGQPLAEPHLSRTPHRLAVGADNTVVLTTDPKASPLFIDGEPTGEVHHLTAGDLERGVVMRLADRVVLLLHIIPLAHLGVLAGTEDLIGASLGIARVREEIARVAGYDVHVLLRGETGTGKELAAHAIHKLSARAEAPFVAVNMAAIPPSTAAAALFGHERGAFTGATQASDGYFGRADGGTLFLDEIADTPADVQPALLRALESGEVQPLGREQAIQRDVRVIGATDANLESAVERGEFRLPLLERLAGYELRLPPLRERREDIGRLLLHFLREMLTEAGRSDKLAAPVRGEPAWLTAELVDRAARYSWPGNVRQLRNVAQRVVINWSHARRVPGGNALATLFRDDGKPANHATGETATSPPAGKPARQRRALRDIPEAEVIEALRRHEFRPGPAADALGVARSSMYALMESSPSIRKASDLPEPEVSAALREAGGDVRVAARQLEVSERGLRLRMTQLGLG